MAKKKTVKKSTKKPIAKSNSHAKAKTTKTKKVVKKQKGINKNLVIGLGIAAVIIILGVILLSTRNKVSEEIGDMGALVAKVNGMAIYEQDLVNEVRKLPAQLQQVMDEKTVLSQIIDKTLLNQEAEKANINIEAEINSLLEQNNITLEQLENDLLLQGFTMEEFKAQLITFKFLNETVFANLEASDEEIETFYKENKELFIMGESVKAKHILVSTTEKSEEEALALIKDIQAQFEEDNSVFCDLVTEYSDDPGSLSSCGEYPAFTMDSTFVQEYKDTAFNNKVGEASIAKTQFGYHLIWTTEKIPATTYELEEIKTELEANIIYEKQKEMFSEYINTLRSKAKITNCLENPETKECMTEKEEKAETKEEKTEEVEESTENLAECLGNKGAKMYGAYWCSHCENQKKTFGDDWKHIEYVECAEEDNPREQTAACKEAGISGYPTWEINGKQYPGEMSLDKLAKISGCSA